MDGDEGFDELGRPTGGDLLIPAGPAVTTGGGGAHIYFATTGHRNRAKFRPGLDWRGASGGDRGRLTTPLTTRSETGAGHRVPLRAGPPSLLGNVSWSLAWAIMFRSTGGVALTPVWFLAFLLHAMIEEDALERAYGSAYRTYKARVRSRIIPGLPL